MSKITLTPEPLPPTNDKIQLRRKPSLTQVVLTALSNGAWEATNRYLGSVDSRTSVHGSVPMDRAAAALALQNHGKKHGIDQLATANWAEIDKAISAASRQMYFEGRPIDRKSRKKAAIEQQNLQLPFGDVKEGQ